MSTSVLVDPAEVDRALGRVRAMVLPRLRSAIDRLPPPVRDVAGYHFGWSDEAGRPANGSPDALLRPALTVLCAEAVGGDAEPAVDAAVAVELVHNFALLRDEVLDGDPSGRHRRTVWSLFGVRTAILAGDALLALAIDVLAEAPESVTTLCADLRELLHGQSLNVSFQQYDDVSVADWLTMASGKTATLLACAAELGAMHGGGTLEQTVAIRRFGWHLGIACHLLDDRVDISGDPTLDDGRAWARAEADRHVREALHFLTAARPTTRAYAGLAGLVQLVTRGER